MKFLKFFVMNVLCVATLYANATVTAKANITVSSVGGANDLVMLYQEDASSAAFESGKDISKLMNPANGVNVNIYAVTTAGNLSCLVTDDLTNTALTFQSNATETAYTMTFSNVAGTVKLYDAVTGTETVLANSGTYNFTCAANSTIADRFFVNYVPSAPKICHRYGALQVYGSKDMTVKVLNMDGTATSIADTNITTNSEVEIPLAGLAAGQYKVEWNSQTLIIDVK